MRAVLDRMLSTEIFKITKQLPTTERIEVKMLSINEITVAINTELWSNCHDVTTCNNGTVICFL